jgi:hypothetical protein
MKYKYSDIKNSFHSQEPWINVFLLKYLTVPLVYLMVNFTNITPNFISIISLIFGISSAFFYFTGDLFFGCLLYFIAYIFDATDGKVARIKGNGTAYGFWVDTFIDRFNLVIISSAISYNFFVTYNDFHFLLLNSIFLGLAFIGWESRYNIDFYKLKFSINLKENRVMSSYEKWCLKKGLVKEPISLPELFLFYLLVVPHLNNELSIICIIVVIFLLLARLCKQQIFWFNVANR